MSPAKKKQTAESTSPQPAAVRYIETVGRRKSAVARLRLTPSPTDAVFINGKPLEHYFPQDELRRVALDAFTRVKLPQKFTVSVHLSGGGLNAQAEAVRHASA